MKVPLYAVVVTFRVADGRTSEFLEAAILNARASLQEQGCVTFDVCQSGDHAEYLFYELYLDRASFDEHCSTPHFFDFDKRTAAWVKEKIVKTYVTAVA